MKAWISTAAVVLLVGLAWFGRSAWGGYFLADDSPSMDIYHLSTLYERWAHYLLQGTFPTWMPEFAAGYPAPASWMYGLLYPGHLLFAALPADMAWTWSALLHMVLGGVGVHRLVRSETGDDLAAVTAGLVFALSEFMIGRTLYGHLNLVAPVAWAPWLFVHLRGIAAGRRRAVAWCIACGALGLLAGHVQVWFYVLPALAVYALVLGRRLESRASFVRQLAVVATLVACISAVQWLPALELSRLSQRAAASSADVVDFSATGHALVAKLFPGSLGYRPTGYWAPDTAEHEFGAVGGLLLLALALPAVRRRRAADLVWVGVAAAGLLLAPGVHNPVSEFLNEIPPMRWGRTPARALILTLLAVSVLAGRGVAEWRRIVRDQPSALRREVLLTGTTTLAVGAAGAAALFALLGDAGIGDHTGTVVRAIVTSVVLAGGVLVVPTIARAQPRAWLALPAIVVAGTVLGGAQPARSIRSDFFRTDWASMVPAQMAEHRMHLLSARFPNVERQGLRTLREICYVDAHWFHEFLADPSPGRAAWLDVGVELGDIPRERVMTGVLDASDLVGKPYESFGPGQVFDGALVEPDSDRVLAAIDGGARALYLAAPADGAGGTDSRPVPGAAVRRAPTTAPDEVNFEVTTPSAGWLIVSEKHYPGWTATVNGAETEIHRANVMFRAVQVPQGTSRVEFVYRPWTVRTGAILMLLGVLGTLGVLVRTRRSAR